MSKRIASMERRLAMEPDGPLSLAARATNLAVRALMKNGWAYSPKSDAGLVRLQRAAVMVARAVRLPSGASTTPEDVDGMPAEWVRAGLPDERRVFLYLHGGGYFFGTPRLHRPLTWRLAAATARPVFVPDYRLAPRHTPVEALEDVLRAYDFLLSRGYGANDIVVGGDSAGGHLTLGLLIALREQGRALPAAAVCLSPWVDLSCSAESHRLNRRSDAMIPADKLAWLGREYGAGRDVDDPLFAPQRDDFKGLPPMMVIVSGAEILRDDARDLVARARTAGVDVTYQEWPGQVHVFPVFADFVPEGRAAFRHIAEFLRAAGV